MADGSLIALVLHWVKEEINDIRDILKISNLVGKNGGLHLSMRNLEWAIL
jgi:hypothetical protein